MQKRTSPAPAATGPELDVGNFQELKAKTCLLFQESVKVLRLTLPNDLPGDRQVKQKVRSL